MEAIRGLNRGSRGRFDRLWLRKSPVAPGTLALFTKAGYCGAQIRPLPARRQHHATAQHRHHRPRRPRQDHAGRQPAPAVRHRSATTSASPSAMMDSNDLERERGITILAKSTSRRLEGHAHQHRRHARPRRLRRRGRAHPRHGRRRDRARRRGRRPDAADQVRAVARRSSCGLKPIVVHQQDRPAGRAPRTKCSTKSSTSSPTLDANDEQLDFPIIYRLGQATAGWRDRSDGPKTDMAPLFDRSC